MKLPFVMELPVWIALGQSMIDFVIIATGLWLIVLILRTSVRPLPPRVRYAIACGALVVFSGVAVAVVAWRWPDRVVVVTEPQHVATQSSSEMSLVLVPTPAVMMTQPVLPTVDVSEKWDQVLARWVPWIWLCGAPCVAVFVACGWIGASRLRSDSLPVDESSLRRLFTRLAVNSGVTHAAIAVCDRLKGPVVVGIWRPLVLIPPSLLTSLSLDQWEMILRHELAHIRRADNLVNLVQRGVETILFFHPAVWWTSAWIRLEREHCCDEEVLNEGATAQAYAETLAMLALPGVAPQLATAAMANHQLLARMRRILGTEELEMAVSRRKVAAITATVGCLVGLAAFAVTSFAHDEDKDVIEKQEDGARESQAAAAIFSADAHESEQAMIKSLRAEIELLKHENEQNDKLRQLQEWRAFASTLDGPEAKQLSDSLEIVISRLTQPKSQSISTPNMPYLLDDVRGQLRASLGSTSTSAGATEQPKTPDRRDWSAGQATGKPDVPKYGDDRRAWASVTPDGGPEWLRVGFEEARPALAVIVHESCNPGAITRVDVGIASEGGNPTIVPAWTGIAEIPNADEIKVTVIPLKLGAAKIDSVTVHLDTRKVPGWNEIDAVGLLDQAGAIHWATTAVATSNYGVVSHQSKQPAIEFSLVEHSTGAPDVLKAGDNSRAWASKTPDGQEEWLELTYDPPVPAAAVLVYETFNPGALIRVIVEEEGTIKASPTNAQISVFPKPSESPVPVVTTFAVEESTPKSIWEGSDPVQIENGKGIAVIPLPSGLKPLRKVRLYLDSPAVKGWNEIDAVGLVNAKTGLTQWASRATASSSFGHLEGQGVGGAGVSGDFSFVETKPVIIDEKPAFDLERMSETYTLHDAVHQEAMAEYRRAVEQLKQSQCARCHSNPHEDLNLELKFIEKPNDEAHEEETPVSR